MTLKSTRSIYSTCVILILVFNFLLPTNYVQALTNHIQSSDKEQLDEFVDPLMNGEADELRGIFIPDILSVRIVRQPVGMYEFVSPRPNTVTQFDLASRFGSIGLLAHNHLAGDGFSLLKEEQEIYLIYGNGQIDTYVVRETFRYQALEPESYSSDFMDLDSGSILTASELFLKVYNRPGRVILQTCISTDTSSSWGRLFIIAEPYPDNQ
jgi:hypothetical protein